MGMADAVSPYAYVRNNPVNLVDPFGLKAQIALPAIQSAYPAETATDWYQPTCGVGDSCAQLAVGLAVPGRAAAAPVPGTPGYQGLQQKPEQGGYEALTGQATSPPPSVGQQINTAIRGFVDATTQGFNQVANIFKSDSSILGANIEAAGNARPADSAAHHIVPSGSNNADAIEARRRLGRFGIDINSADNGVFLPNSPASSATGAYHPSLHTDRYYGAVNDALGRARTKDQAIGVLNDIKLDLLNNSFPK